MRSVACTCQARYACIKQHGAEGARGSGECAGVACQGLPHKQNRAEQRRRALIGEYLSGCQVKAKKAVRVLSQHHQLPAERLASVREVSGHHAGRRGSKSGDAHGEDDLKGEEKET